MRRVPALITALTAMSIPLFGATPASADPSPAGEDPGIVAPCRPTKHDSLSSLDDMTVVGKSAPEPDAPLSSATLVGILGTRGYVW